MVVKDAAARRSAGLHLHRRRRPEPVELPARRRRQQHQRALQHAELHRLPGSGYSLSESRAWRAGSWRRRPAPTARRCRTSTSRRRDRDLHVHEPKSGRSVVVKDAQPNDPQDFAFTAGGGLSPTPFQLDDDGNASNARRTRARSPTSRPDRATRSPRRCQRAGPSVATCSDGSPRRTSTSRAGEKSPAPSPTAGRPRIMVVKDAQPDDPQDFSFTTGGGLSPAQFQLDDDGDDSTRSRALAPSRPAAGVRLLGRRRHPVPGWDASATCSDGSPPSNISSRRVGHLHVHEPQTREHHAHLDTQPGRSAGLHLHDHRRPEPVELPARRRRRQRQRASNTGPSRTCSADTTRSPRPRCRVVQEQARARTDLPFRTSTLSRRDVTCTFVMSRSKIVV